MANKILTREAILACKDLTIELVSCPEWDGDIYVRSLTAGERDDYEKGMLQFRGKRDPGIDLTNARARLAALTVCDDAGNRMFSDSDITALAAKSSLPLDRIYMVAMRLSGITKEDIEELEKNSVSGQFVDSSSS